MPAASPRAPEGVARSTAWVLMSYVGTAGFTAVLTLYLVRALGPAEYGVLSLAMGVAGLLALPADFGIAASASRFIAERRGDPDAAADLFAAATRLKLVVAGGIAVLTVLLAGPIADAYGEPDLTWPLRGIALSVMMQSTMGLFTGVLVAMGHAATNLRMVIVESAVEAGASILLVVAGAGAAGAAWGRGIGYLAGVLIGVVLIARLLGRRAVAVHRRAAPVAQMARYAGALMIVNGAYSLFSQLDVILIGAILTTTAVGAFSAPLRLSVLLHYPAMALAASLSPRAARVDGEEPDYAAVQRGLRLLLLLSAFTVAPVVAWARPITDLLLGGEYDDSATVLQVMAPFIYLQGPVSLLAMSVNYVGAAGRRIPVSILAVVVNVVIDVALLEPMGVAAAAVGTSVAYVVYGAGHLRICAQTMRLRLWPLFRSAIRSLLAAAAMAGVLLLVGHRDLGVLEWAGGLLAGSAAFAVVLLALRETTVAEARALVRR